MPIFSRQNPLVKQYRQVRAGLERRTLFLEGIRLIEDALGSQVALESVMVARDLLVNPRLTNLIEQLTQQGVRCEVTSWEILEYVSDVETPPGIVALAPRREWNVLGVLDGIQGVPLFVVAEGWRDPGNFGTMLRSGEALGVDAVIATPQTVDAFSPKVMRASMGSALRLPVIDQADLTSTLALLKERHCHIVTATVEADTILTDIDFTQPTAIVVGNEAVGASPEAVAAATRQFKIPMRASVESLNAAMATTIILYEAARQRKFQRSG